jgi:hypothetical protein
LRLDLRPLLAEPPTKATPEALVRVWADSMAHWSTLAGLDEAGADGCVLNFVSHSGQVGASARMDGDSLVGRWLLACYGCIQPIGSFVLRRTTGDR